MYAESKSLKKVFVEQPLGSPGSAKSADGRKGVQQVPRMHKEVIIKCFICKLQSEGKQVH